MYFLERQRHIQSGIEESKKMRENLDEVYLALKLLQNQPEAKTPTRTTLAQTQDLNDKIICPVVAISRSTPPSSEAERLEIQSTATKLSSESDNGPSKFAKLHECWLDLSRTSPSSVSREGPKALPQPRNNR